MADSSPLAGLLDRAAQILNLVGELADAIRTNEHSPGDEIQRRVATAWNSLLPAIVEVGESLPPDPNPVGDWIRKVGRVSKWFDGAVRQHGLANVLFRFNCDGFIRVDEEGRALFKEMAAKRDPFAFVDAPAASSPLGIDTTPATPKPPIQFVEADSESAPDPPTNPHLTHQPAFWAARHSPTSGRSRPATSQSPPQRSTNAWREQCQKMGRRWVGTRGNGPSI